MTARESPVVGADALRSLILEVGITDPEDTSVNSLLKTLRVADEIEESGESATVAVISGADDSAVRADRAVAHQVDELIEELQPTSAVVIVDSVDEERLIPIIESRVAVDAVDRVVVRQARDIESTYYLLKQFLADEELRQTTLVPIGVALVAFPVLVTQTSPEVAGAIITAIIGIFLIYKGLGLDGYVGRLPGWTKRSLYSGRVSIVTYVVAGGLALIGVFAGLLGASHLAGPEDTTVILVMKFVFDSIPWLAMAGVAATLGRLIDDAIQNGHVPASYLNIPFGVVALGVVIRGFSAYFLQTGGWLGAIELPTLEFGPISVAAFELTAGQRLAGFVLLGVLVSLIGVRVSTYFGDLETHDLELAE